MTMNPDLLRCFKRMKASTISAIFQPPPKRSAKEKRKNDKQQSSSSPKKDKGYAVSLVTVKV